MAIVVEFEEVAELLTLLISHQDPDNPTDPNDPSVLAAVSELLTDASEERAVSYSDTMVPRAVVHHILRIQRRVRKQVTLAPVRRFRVLDAWGSVILFF